MLIPKSDTELTKKDFLAQEATPFHYVAIGDSLTEGVGDTTNQGGFVPLLAQSLTDTYDYQVTDSNYGVSGIPASKFCSGCKKRQTFKNHWLRQI